MSGTMNCPACGRLIALRFPVHECKAEEKAPPMYAILNEDGAFRSTGIRTEKRAQREASEWGCTYREMTEQEIADHHREAKEIIGQMKPWWP